MQNIKEYTEARKLEIRQLVDTLSKKPTLAIIKVGYVEASSRYVKNKIKDCTEVGIPTKLIQLEATITESELISKIKELNNDPEITGFIVQLPLPSHIKEAHVIETITPEKDVDGFSKLALVNPGTPQGVINYLEAQNYDFRDKNAVVLGRSNIVGMPLSQLLLAKNCNVTVLHSKTSESNKKVYLENADLICTAAGKANLITSEYKLKPTAVIYDIGINFTVEGKLVGDCAPNLPVAFQSPVPGGAGLTTRLALITNLLKLQTLQNTIC